MVELFSPIRIHVLEWVDYSPLGRIPPGVVLSLDQTWPRTLRILPGWIIYYQNLTKVLTVMLKQIFSIPISEVQSAFVPDRKISNDLLVTF